MASKKRTDRAFKTVLSSHNDKKTKHRFTVPICLEFVS